MNKQLTKALGSFHHAQPLEPSMAEALENLLEKAIADPTNGGTLVPVHIVDKNGHHTVRYHAREEVHALRAHKDNHHVSELQAGDRFSHPKNGDGVITKVKGHDGKGYELATKYDSGKNGTAYVHNVRLLKPEHDALPADAKADLKRRVLGGDDEDKGDSIYAKIQANKKPVADKPVVKRKAMPNTGEDTLKNISLPVRPRGGQDVLTRRQLDDMEVAIKQGRDGQINVTDVIKRVQQIGALGAAAVYQKEVLKRLNTLQKPAGDDPKTRSGKSIMNGQFPHKQEGWTSADHEDAVDYHKSQRGSLTINGITNTHADFARGHASAADSRRAQDHKDDKENEFLDSTLPISDERYNEQQLKRSLRDKGVDKYKAMKRYLQNEHTLFSEDLDDDDNDTLANLLSRSNRDKLTPDQLKFQLDTLAIEAQKRNAKPKVKIDPTTKTFEQDMPAAIAGGGNKVYDMAANYLRSKYDLDPNGGSISYELRTSFFDNIITPLKNGKITPAEGAKRLDGYVITHKQNLEAKKTFDADANSVAQQVGFRVDSEDVWSDGKSMEFQVRTRDRGPRTDHGGGKDGDDWMSDQQIERHASVYEQKYKGHLATIRKQLEGKGYTNVQTGVDYGEKGHISLTVKADKPSKAAPSLRTKEVQKGKFYIGTKSTSPHSDGGIWLQHDGETLDHYDTEQDANQKVLQYQDQARKTMSSGGTHYVMDHKEAKKYPARLDD